MKKAAIVMGMISVLITMPIWFYLQYKILTMVNATELMFFLFWVYVPFSALLNICAKIIVKE